MKAGWTDPQGPRTWRLMPYVVPALMIALAILGPLATTPATLLVVASIAVFNAIGIVNVRQRKPRTAELTCGPGFVDVTKSGARNQRIHARDIVGATTARTASGLLLTLQHRQRDQPVTLELDSDAEAEKIRHALGIGHGGFGTISWRTHTDALQRAAFAGRIFAFAVALLTLLLTLAVSNEAGLIVGALLGQFGLMGAALGLLGLLAKRPEATVAMGADGLRLKTPRGWFALPYAAVQQIDDHNRGLVFAVPEPYNTVAVERVGPLMGGPSANDRKVLIAQVTAAAQRARGLGPHKNDVSGRLDVLRRNDESPRDWLVRLDMAGQMLSAGPGYRGNALDTQDLWTILEDPEAEAVLRAAAARILRHAPTPDARVRIDAAVAAVRDDSTNRRLRVAIQDDLDTASQELAFLDATEPPLQAMNMPAPHGLPHGR